MQLITPATEEPVSVTELARNLRLFTGDGDYTGGEQAHLQALISAARADAEHYTGRFFARQTMRQYFRDFEPIMPLHPELMTVEALRYFDAENQFQTLDAGYYFATLDSLMFVSRDYPAVYERSDAVQIDFIVGPSVPKPTVKQAILLIASHWYENREATSPLQVREVPMNYTWLLDSHVIHPRFA